MSAPKYTPGEWHDCGHDRGGCVCGLIWSRAIDMPIAQALRGCDEEGVTYPEEAVRANARLIAAAPDLLGALRDILADLEQDAIPNRDDSWWKRARAALAKAEGRS